jgi:hypothetical protein
MEQYLTYWLNKETWRLVSVNEVERWLWCGCVCPECGTALVKKDRWEFRKRRAHFAHYELTKNCNETIAYESTLHKLAKQIIFNTKEIVLPFFDFKWQSLPSMRVCFDRVSLESKQVDLIPDAIWYLGNKEIWIEFAKTHYVDDIKTDKLQKIQTRWIECIEIDLKWQLLEELRDFLISFSDNRYWINHPSGIDEINTIIQQNKLKKALDAEKNRLAKEEKSKSIRIKIEELKKNWIIEYKFKKTYNRPYDCPKIIKELNQLKLDGFTKHPILNWLINGSKDTNWNIYWYINSYIFYKNEKYLIYDNPNERQANFLFAGLKKIQGIKEQVCFGCAFNKTKESINEFSYHEGEIEIVLCSYTQ